MLHKYRNKKREISRTFYFALFTLLFFYTFYIYIFLSFHDREKRGIYKYKKYRKIKV